MRESGNDTPVIAGLVAGALAGAVLAAALLRRRHSSGPGSVTQPLQLPPPDSAVLAEARAAAAEITARLRGAFPHLNQ